MGHEIYEENMYVDERNGRPWHRVGVNNETGLTVHETAALLDIPDVWLEPLKLQGRASKWAVVMRSPSKRARNRQDRVIGTPVHAGKFTLISHKDAIEMWDSCVRDDSGNPARVESMGLLGELGQRMFITSELPGFDAAGQEVTNYLVLINPVKPGLAIKAMVTSVLPVCWNTLQWGMERATQTIIVRHTDGAHERVAESLSGLYGNALMTLDVIREAANILTATPVTDMQAKSVFDAVYAYPKTPDLRLVAQSSDSERLDKWNEKRAIIDDAREKLMGLFQGGGMGLQDSRIAGTAWAAWQSVTEFETHRDGGNSHDFRLTELFDGSRYARIVTAQKMLLNMAAQ